jgi:hypothetical protein
VAQGLAPTVHDVSPDEGGNVYVAAGEAVFAKRGGDAGFVRFDADTSGLTRNCWDPAEISNKSPPGEPYACPIISVAGSTPGKAIIGFKGVGTDYDYDAPWALRSGGADVVSFDGNALTRVRHVLIATPPGVICAESGDPNQTLTDCPEKWPDSIWITGRLKLRQVNRILVNHDRSRPLSHGDAFLGGSHATITVLVANPEARGWIDLTRGDPAWADTKGVWEHEHPAPPPPPGMFLAGEGWALALDPDSNVPWYANEFRIARLPYYATHPHPWGQAWWGGQDPPYPHLALWAQESDPFDAAKRDNVRSMSFCDDGTLWVASVNHGLARRAPGGGTWSFVDLPEGSANAALAIACDPSDASVWVGFARGGFGRLKNGQWSLPPAGAPAFAGNPVQSIQIDRWSSPRVVYLAHVASWNGAGGVTVYAGP